MEVPITKFRREIFTLVNQALDGNEVWVTHKGRRLKLVPEGRPVNRLSRITTMEIINSGGIGLDDEAMKAEMTRSWEQDWERDFGPAPNSKSVSSRAGIKP
jgi:antitoxin (DNA-binding transcriptional repressor) of toxin-antitoxin stability system